MYLITLTVAGGGQELSARVRSRQVADQIFVTACEEAQHKSTAQARTVTVDYHLEMKSGLHHISTQMFEFAPIKF